MRRFKPQPGVDPPATYRLPSTRSAAADSASKVGQLARIVAEVAVHLDNHLAARLREQVPEGLAVRRTQPFLVGSMENVDVVIRQRELIRKLAGAVGRIVVNDEDVRSGHALPDRGDDRAQVLSLVVGG